MKSHNKSTGSAQPYYPLPKNPVNLLWMQIGGYARSMMQLSCNVLSFVVTLSVPSLVCTYTSQLQYNISNIFAPFNNTLSTIQVKLKTENGMK